MEHGMMQQQIRLGLRMNALDATPAGTTNTGIAVFAAAPVAANPASQFANGNWVTVTNDAADGTSFKFLRKGIYKFDVCVPLTAEEVPPIMIAGSLNHADLTDAAVDITNVDTFEDYTLAQQIAALQVSLKLHFTVHITNTLRGSATYATTAPVGTSPTGTARIHIGDGAGGAANAVAVDVANATLRLSQLAELFG